MKLINPNIDINDVPSETNWSPTIQFADKNGIRIGQVYSRNGNDGSRTISLASFVNVSGVEKQSTLALCIEADGTTYVTVPTYSTPDYSNKIVTFKSLQNYSPQKLTTSTTFHVNANTGSDTADLFNGRGLSEDKPFKTLDGCLNFLIKNAVVSNMEVSIILHSDVTLGSTSRYDLLSAYRIVIISDNTVRTITFTNNVVFCGYVVLQNVNLAMGSYILQCYGFYRPSTLYLQNKMAITGTNMQIHVYGSQAVLTCNSGLNITFNGTAHNSGLLYVTGGYTSLHKSSVWGGTVTGKRYNIVNGGSVFTGGKGINLIPGTVAGTCDSSSIYV